MLLDSERIGAINKDAAIMKNGGEKLHLAAAMTRVASALAIAKLDRVFSICPDQDSACADL